MNILFYSYTELHYPQESGEPFQEFHSASQGLAITSIVFFSLYAVGRYISNPVAGLYMFKRILIPAIIFSAYERTILLLPLIIL